MFEKIFGSGEKEELEKELENVRKENEKIREKLEEKNKKLEKEKERAKKAITEKQETDKKLKEAEHKIESLEDRIERLEREEKEKDSHRRIKFFTRTELVSLIEELETIELENSSLITHYIESLDEISKEEKTTTLRRIDSQTGYIYLEDQTEIIKTVIVPPLPIESKFYRNKKFKLDKFRKIIKTDKKIGFVSAHAGKSAIGTIINADFDNFEIIKGNIKGKHSKGGFSQGRFERGRKEQLEKYAKEIVEKINESMNDIDYLILDGNKKIISKIEEMISIKGRILERSLDISKISEGEKNSYVEKVLGCRVYIL